MKTTFLWLLLLCGLLISSAVKAQTQSIEVQINASSDDAEERGANASSGTGQIDLTSSDLEFTNDGGASDQRIGMRFTNIIIPQGAMITKAYIQFAVDETDNSPGTVIFMIEDNDSTTTFTGSDFDISSRPVLNDSVVWSNIPEWTVEGEAGTDQQSPDLSALIQAIINRNGWKSGNSLNIISHGTGERTAEAFDGTSSLAPALVVEFITPVISVFNIQNADDDAENDVNTGSMDLTSSDIELTTDGSELQLIGLRFEGLDIPAGSNIINAYIQFTVDEVNSSGDVDVAIACEEADHASTITSSSNNLASRTFSSNMVSWDDIAGWDNIGDSGPEQRTPDLSTIIQEIIDRPGWEKGNAILFGMIDPTLLSIPGYSGNASKRVAQSYDNDPGNAARLVLSYIPPAVFQAGTFPISKGSSWKYDDSGTDLGNTWTALSYNDSSWAFGYGILGYGDGNETTILDFGGDPGSKHPTYYLRHTFEVEDVSIYDSLIFSVMRDDGAVVYVNGSEAFRMNMPTGTIDYNTYASSAVGGSNETNYFESRTANLLQDGLNVIAVELHQSDASSSDLGFDMSVDFKLPPLDPASYPLSKNAEWHYLDDGSSLDAIDWKDTSFNDDYWAFGQGPLGYGDPMNTTISYGSDPNNKHITYYFRRDIMIDMNTIPDSVEFGIRRDDGVIVYVNGTEVIRDNMPSGTITHTTLAPNTIGGSDETTYYSFILKKSIFRDGINVIAVELHNRDLFSSDLGFDLYIDKAPEINPPALGCSNGKEEHIACFTSIAPTSQTSNLLIPTESHRFQMIFKQGDAYTKGFGNVPGNHDFTAYTPLNGSSEMGHLSVNHENSPGGVSVIDLHYDASNKLWVVDTTQAVDFSNSDLVTTSRNCSGGITPWGTVITAEESTSNGDVNGDGYVDVGWLVEIDPITAKVKEYGNNKQEKLWATGRVSHENAVVLNDSITLYTGEDGGSSAVFKFVANSKGDLSKGDLYALKLDGQLSGGDPTSSTASWVQIPNTTQTERNTTGSLASSLGATNFNGVEDIEVSPLDGKMYFTSKGFNRVYRFTDNGSTVSNFETFVGGTSYILNTEQGIFTEPWASGNDNLTFDNEGNLWVLQDGSNNYIWVVRPDHSQSSPKVELFASPPVGSEPTGLTFSPDYRFGFVSIQHPSGSNTSQPDATFGDVIFNASATIVFARKEHLGPQPPKAGFISDTTVVIAGNTVTFMDTSINNPSSRQWIFDGGTPAVSNNEVQAVKYNGVGIYDVQLSVANLIGADTLIYSQYIEVIAPAPETYFSASKTFVEVGDTVEFYDFSTNNPDSWEWIFQGGDPLVSTEQYPKVVYNEAGFYDVALTVANRAGSGSTETKTEYIEVTDKLGIKDRELGTRINIYPNPSSGFVNLEMELQAGQDITIESYDLSGKKLLDPIEDKTHGGLQNWSIDLSELNTQTVMLIITVNGTRVQRIVQLMN